MIQKQSASKSLGDSHTYTIHPKTGAAPQGGKVGTARGSPLQKNTDYKLHE